MVARSPGELCVGHHVDEIMSVARPRCSIAVIPAAVEVAEQPDVVLVGT